MNCSSNPAQPLRESDFKVITAEIADKQLPDLPTLEGTMERLYRCSECGCVFIWSFDWRYEALGYFGGPAVGAGWRPIRF